MKKILLFIAFCLLVLPGCTQKTVQNLENAADAVPPISQPAVESESVEPEPADNSKILNNEISNQANTMDTVKITTNKGVIKIKLNPEKAPVTVENFKKYIEKGFYADTIFHRVIPGFMVQGGGFGADKQEKPTDAPIAIESDNGLNNNRGTIAMARTSDPNSATSQFFINLADNDFLNYTSSTDNGYGYAVFGEVVEGMEAVDAIAAVRTGNNGPHQNWPVENVIIENIEIID